MHKLCEMALLAQSEVQTAHQRTETDLHVMAASLAEPLKSSTAFAAALC